MRVTFICCPFKTSFGSYASSLKSAIENKTGDAVQWVGSNCGCGDPIERNRQFQIPKAQCNYFEMPIFADNVSKKAWKRPLKSMARSVLLPIRGKRYASMSADAEVAHFQQILNAYGSQVVFSWLRQPSGASRIVTVHELDADQLKSPKSNETYNLADAIIVHCEEMRQHLIRLGVRQEKIHVVLHGVNLPAPAAFAPAAAEEAEHLREGIIFYGGHKLMSGKGIETLFKAMSIIGRQMPATAPLLKIHGHYGTDTPPEGLQLAAQYQVADKVVWLNQIPDEETVRLYQHSLLCALPYTGSFAGYAASLAAACRLPVVCTRKAGLPDHLGETAVWIDENSPEQLAERMMELLNNEPCRRRLGEQLFKQADACMRWEVIAEQTLKIYQQAALERISQDAKHLDEVTARAV
jgi:glycosyltransferase involved in cell wall biosynthesis